MKEPMSGMQLELDVMKKMAKQLARLPNTHSRLRAAEYVTQTAAEDNTAALASVVTKKNGIGQTQFSATETDSGKDIFE